MGRPRKDAVRKTIPITEDGIGVTCTTVSGMQYYISQNTEKRKHTLWRVVDGGYQIVSTADSPYDLYGQINWE